MIEKIFFDTNIIIDIIQDRPNAEYARKILEYAAKDKYVHIYVSYLSVANAAFVLRKRKIEEIKSEITSLMRVLNVISSNDIQILDAIKCGSPDFEDSLQIACAESKNCDVIVTSNTSHFKQYTDIPVISPIDFVARCCK